MRPRKPTGAARGTKALSLRATPHPSEGSGALIIPLFPYASGQANESITPSQTLPKCSFIFFRYSVFPQLGHLKTLNFKTVMEEKKENSLALHLRAVLSYENPTLSP